MVGNFRQIISPAVLTLLSVIMSAVMVIIVIMISTIKDSKTRINIAQFNTAIITQRCEQGQTVRECLR